MLPTPGASGILQIQELIQRMINLSVGFAFVTLTLMLVYAGFLFLTSGGDAGAIKKAGAIITWGLLGVLFLALAWLALKLIEAYTGVPLTKFCTSFPGPGFNQTACF